MKKNILTLSLFALLLSAACAKGSGFKVVDFKSQNLDGQAVDKKIFSKAEITVLNVWGTFCPPCVGEMPELGKWAKEMPEGARLLGLLVDVPAGDKAGIKRAKKILLDADADFENILADQSLEPFLANIQFVPTTFLIDKNGNIVGEPIVGARVDQYKKAVKKYLNEKNK